MSDQQEYDPTRRVLDRVPSIDPGRLRYPVRTAIRTAVPRVSKIWTPGLVTDQGYEGACVGHGWTSDFLASPYRVEIGPTFPAPISPLVPDAYAQQYYEECRRNDEWAGENYDGTSVNAGARLAQRRGLIGQYRWAFSVSDVIDSIITRGPVILGVAWWESMYYTNQYGRLMIGGQIVGGHCLLAYGYNPSYNVTGYGTTEIIRLRNSWGPSWGLNGNGYITVRDFERMWAEQGECCVPLARYTRPQVATVA